jgi:thymidylate kinase
VSEAVLARAAAPEDAGPLGLRVALALGRSGIPHCQWKGRHKRDRWMAGRGDLDLLVDRTAAARFAAVLEALDFKLAQAPPERQAAGVQSFVGYDRGHGRLIHVHAHFALVVGRPWACCYRLPFADAVIESVVPGTPFPAPAPGFDLLLLLLRATLLHDPRDLWRREPVWLRAARTEWAALRDAAASLPQLLARHLPDVSLHTLDRAAQALQPGCPAWRRLAARAALERELRPHKSRAPLAARAHRVLTAPVRLFRRPPAGKRLASGGAVIALIGADGAGKSSCARALGGWLGTELWTRPAHLGRPARSILTLLAGGAYKAARGLDILRGEASRGDLAAHLELLRYLCTARDRYRLYRRVRGHAAAGGIAICERYPVPGNRILVGPSREQGRALSANSDLARLMRRWETRYYARMARPEITFVLRVDPEVAVRRKTDEPADYVRARAWALCEVDWSASGATVIDANQPLRDILTDLRERVWQSL